MLFEKVIIDGIEYYKRTEKSENTKNEMSDLAENNMSEVSLESMKNEECDNLDETQDIFEKIGESAKNVGGKIVDSAKDLGKKIAVGAKDFGKKIKEGTENLLGKEKVYKENSDNTKMIALLPYMSAEENHSIINRIMESSDFTEELILENILPYLSSEDCDALVLKCFDAAYEKINFENIVSFISAQAIHNIVDGYLLGTYITPKLDTLYPYLPENEMKRIYNHLMTKREITELK